MTDWKSIGSCPDDGRNVLMYFPDLDAAFIGRNFKGNFSYTLPMHSNIHGCEPSMWADIVLPPNPRRRPEQPAIDRTNLKGTEGVY